MEYSLGGSNKSDQETESRFLVTQKRILLPRHQNRFNYQDNEMNSVTIIHHRILPGGPGFSHRRLQIEVTSRARVTNLDDADRMFNSFLGRAGGRGTKGNKNSLVNWDPTIFDNKDTVNDFTNQLLPQQQGGVSTQPQAAANPLVPPGQAAGAAAAAAAGAAAAAAVVVAAAAAAVAAAAAAAAPPIKIVPQVQPPQQWGGGTREARHRGAQITLASRRPCRGWGTRCMTRPPLTLSLGYRARWLQETPRHALASATLWQMSNNSGCIWPCSGAKRT
jgi:hypothetical protein